jgi:hypothetical protein
MLLSQYFPEVVRKSTKALSEDSHSRDSNQELPNTRLEHHRYTSLLSHNLSSTSQNM